MNCCELLWTVVNCCGLLWTIQRLLLSCPPSRAVQLHTSWIWHIRQPTQQCGGADGGGSPDNYQMWLSSARLQAQHVHVSTVLVSQCNHCALPHASQPKLATQDVSALRLSHVLALVAPSCGNRTASEPCCSLSKGLITNDVVTGKQWQYATKVLVPSIYRKSSC